ncbi:eRF1 methyltransferase catalytic subunit mtq2 [Taenia crassiceps]|uniref:ERF1 methyltransferase catalytic subunit mtq2 n=1 Tax=Taenia crassiceps TaxID=6207 RepID=A0ABR4QTD8_9CEST
MLPLNHACPTPDTDALKRPCFAEVYPPSEDSFLFLDALEADADFIRNRLKPVVSVEVGSGSGIISTFLSKLIDSLHGNKTDAVCCDLLSPIRTSSQGLADIVLFNPPYVPTPGDELLDAKSTISAAWAGGFRGRQVMDSCIQQLTPVLTRSGVLYILLLQQNEPDLVSKLINDVSGGRLSSLPVECMPSRVESLELFRSLVKYIRTLEHSDRRYLLNRVKEEFRKSNKRGKALLKRRRFL